MCYIFTRHRRCFGSAQFAPRLVCGQADRLKTAASTTPTTRFGQREFAIRLPSTATFSLQTNEMGPAGPQKPQFPRRFADANQTSETAGPAKFGL